jgi:TRAP-type C4-dicarboxylate transport system substrate-binding protein
MHRRDLIKYGAVTTGALLGSRLALAGEEPATIKLATVAPDGTPWSEQMKSLKARVDAAGKGALKLKPFLGGALGDENATSAECKRGSIHIWGGSTGALANVVPELGLFELPYLFRNTAEADHVIDTVLAADMQKALEAKGLKLLFWAENGFRNFGTSFGPVKSPDALKGKKMRSQATDAHLEMYRALGASPVPIETTEVLSSLQTGVVDGFDNTPLFTFAASWHKGIKHYSLSEAIYQPGIVVANKDWFAKQGKEVQDALLFDAQGEAVRGRKGVRELGPLLLENFKTEKIALHELSADEKLAFAKLCEPTHEKWAAKNKAGAPLLKKAKAALAELRKKT